MTGLSFAISFPAGRGLLAFTMSRTFSRKAVTFFFDGLIKSLCRFPVLYLRTFWPRKSNPSSIWVMSVFSGESCKPRSRRNASTSGFISCSRSSFELPEMRKSSAYRIRCTFASRLFRVVGGMASCIARSSPSSVISARTGEIIPPYAKQVTMQSDVRKVLICGHFQLHSFA